MRKKEKLPDTPFEKMRAMAAAVIAVQKEEVAKAEQQWREERANRIDKKKSSGYESNLQPPYRRVPVKGVQSFELPEDSVSPLALQRQRRKVVKKVKRQHSFSSANENLGGR